MPEHLEPGPEETGEGFEKSEQPETPEDGGELEEWIEESATRQEILHQIKSEGGVVDDPELPVRFGSVELTMPGLKAGEFFDEGELEIRPDGKQYTEKGILAEKVIAREKFLSERARRLSSHRILDTSYYPGMLGVRDGQIVRVDDMRLEQDPSYKIKRQTLVVLTVTYPDGSRADVKNLEALYTNGLKNVSAEQITANAEQLEIDHGGEIWRIGEFFKVKFEESYIGRIAIIPDQKTNPGQVVVMLRDRTGRSKLFNVWLEDIER